jgi:hypothetical protein
LWRKGLLSKGANPKGILEQWRAPKSRGETNLGVS